MSEPYRRFGVCGHRGQRASLRVVVVIHVHAGELLAALFEEGNQLNGFAFLGFKVMSPASVVDPLPILFIEQPKEKEDASFGCEQGVAFEVEKHIA